ncbi:hypothetical protein B0I37DRAFT_428789 [Chaetomium sp. MPI-CAGE-AT-0009]|nr:hypothetical protein B0I37DRAFT_428789 [Chaetomium sp. MPI-CAGE-AT-0009]
MTRPPPFYEQAMLQTAQLNLPNHKSWDRNATDNDLIDARNKRIDHKITGEMTPETREFLRDTYERVAHGLLDSGYDEDEEDAEDALRAWRDCHNGLWNLRHQRWLGDEHIYHLTERLITWSQEQEDARLGDRSDGNWWILPPDYQLRVPDYDSVEEEEKSAALGELCLGNQEEYDRLHEKFDNAQFTVHLVYHKNHWAILIYQPSNGNSFYLDSLPDGVKDRSKRARAEFRNWLQESNKVLPPKAQNYQVHVPSQEDAWSCGLHAIANALAFLRYEKIGWNRVHGWKGSASKPMRRQLITCLHELMGLKFIPPETPPASAETKDQRGVQKRIAPPKTPAGKSANKPTRDAKKPSPQSFGARHVPRGRELAKAIREAEQEALAITKRLAALRQQQEAEQRAARRAARAQRAGLTGDLPKNPPVAGRRGALSMPTQPSLQTSSTTAKPPSRNQASAPAAAHHEEDGTRGTPQKKRKTADAAAGHTNTTATTPNKQDETPRKAPPPADTSPGKRNTHPAPATTPPAPASTALTTTPKANAKPKASSSTTPKSTPAKRRSAGAEPAAAATETAKAKSPSTPTATATGTARSPGKRKGAEQQTPPGKRRKSGDGAEGGE